MPRWSMVPSSFMTAMLSKFFLFLMLLVQLGGQIRSTLRQPRGVAWAHNNGQKYAPCQIRPNLLDLGDEYFSAETQCSWR